MADFAKEILPVDIEDEMKKSYLDYAMSVIVGRALPDIRDGLKPVHRRVLYAMRELGNDWNKPYKKSARVVGDTIGKYHPHGESAVYDALVRMAQHFSMRGMLIDGQGNFGSVDGDPPAAMRYTEVRMARLAHDLLADIDKETVDFVPNYDGSEIEPSVFPARFPNLLVNGSSGIAVGMATNIPPHHLGEVIDACIAVMDNPSIDIKGIMEIMPGPDFPTAGIINGSGGIVEAYHTGRGRIYVRARANTENIDGGNRKRIVITELPYQVNKARLQEKIAELVKEKKIEGISELRDESDKDGMRLVIELRRGENADVMLKNLYRQTSLETVFGINLVALVEGRPQLLNIRQMLDAFMRHRREVITRRTIFELRKARERAHVLEGFAVALANIDQVIVLIRDSATPAEAKQGLLERVWNAGVVRGMLERAGADTSKPEDLPAGLGLVGEDYRLSEAQAQAILDLRLYRLTGLEKDRIIDEFDKILEKIRELLWILVDPERLREVVREELLEVKEQFADARRTEIEAYREGMDILHLIKPQDVVVTMSYQGYIKWQPLADYSAQRRGGRGKIAASTKEEDFVERLFVANSRDTMLFFSSRGRVYWKPVYRLPQATRTARGLPLVNLLPIDSEQGERISAILPMSALKDGGFMLMATASGIVKKTPCEAFSRPRASGLIAVDLRDDDHLIGVEVTGGGDDVMLATSNGQLIRFPEGDVRSMGRTARGVRGIRLAPDSKVISLMIGADGLVLTATENGYGKCTLESGYRSQSRGGKGLRSILTSERNGAVVAARTVSLEDEIMLITDGGKLVRTRVNEISVVGRNTQGVRLINLGESEILVGVEKVVESEEAEDIESTPIPTRALQPLDESSAPSIAPDAAPFTLAPPDIPSPDRSDDSAIDDGSAAGSPPISAEDDGDDSA
nr:DNA gyrase subunit A [Thioalkalivibrio sp. HK1]